MNTTNENYAEWVTGRNTPLFSDDIKKSRSQLSRQITGQRILVIGGAGSIGSATVRGIMAYDPEVVHVVDQNENGLAELVRDLHGSGQFRDDVDFRTLPIDFGSPIMKSWLDSQEPYDFVLNFAAIKHVRSEKDTWCLLQMFDTNILKPLRLLRWINERGGTGGYFCVSTDKAANPVSLMGASKRIMEHVIFSENLLGEGRPRTTSARFANVAFSDGSLLQSWIVRLNKHQALAAPEDTRRYFISLEEAGQICLLAAFCTPDRHLLIPDFDPAKDLRDLAELGAGFLRENQYEPAIYYREEEARGEVARDMAAGRYPLLLTPLNTSGEKPYEEFVSKGERKISLGLPNLAGIPCLPPPERELENFVQVVESAISDPGRETAKDELVKLIGNVIPEFNHITGASLLDNRM